MANRSGKSIDNSFLSMEQQLGPRGFIHRDYLAHCLRYSHVAKYLLQKGKRHLTAHVLDVGCGKEAPLARLMYSMRLTHTTGSYTGVDYVKVPWPWVIGANTTRFKFKSFGESDFAYDDIPLRKSYDIISCFEVLEHVEPRHAFDMLTRMGDLLKMKGGTAFISTPVYSPREGAAGAHVNEMSYAAMRLLIDLAGFKVDGHWGTFASQKDYKKLLSPAQAEVFQQLNCYYDNTIIACMFAPLFPEQSRNVIWQLSMKTTAEAKKAVEIPKGITKPEHSNSKLWTKHMKQILKENS